MSNVMQLPHFVMTGRPVMKTDMTADVGLSQQQIFWLRYYWKTFKTCLLQDTKEFETKVVLPLWKTIWRQKQFRCNWLEWFVSVACFVGLLTLRVNSSIVFKVFLPQTSMDAYLKIPITIWIAGSVNSTLAQFNYHCGNKWVCSKYGC